MDEIKKEIDRIKEEQLNEKRRKREMKEKKEVSTKLLHLIFILFCPFLYSYTKLLLK